MKAKIKLIMITGFLGSGKTTLLNQLIDLCKGKKMGVIINEFGKISIDGQLIHGKAGKISEINNGSIFCSCLQGSFVTELIRYADLPIEYLFVESSGMADPSNLEELLQIVQKQTDNRYHHDRSICVIDGPRFLSLVPVLPALEKQVCYSNFLLVNKCDLMTQGEKNALTKTLMAMNPHADLLLTSQCRMRDDFIQMTPPAAWQPPQPVNTCNLMDNRPKTIILRTTEICTKEKLIEFLSSISQSVYRAKGFVQCTEGWMLVNVAGEQVVVQSSRHEGDSSTLVFISSIGPSIIRDLTYQWQAYMKIPMTLR